MEKTERTKVTVEATISAPIDKVWLYWSEPKHITKWAFANDDWHAPHAENDLRVNGNFTTTMAAKDGSMSFDFGGIYTHVDVHKLIAYKMADGRLVEVKFVGQGLETKIIETFDAENLNPVEMQQSGWQAILNNFKKYTETH